MTALRCLYDLRHAPVTFDFGIYLALADCARQLLKRDSLDITIRAGEYRQATPRDKETPESEKEWRIHNILLPCTAILPTVRRVSVRYDDGGPYDFPLNQRTPYLARDVLKYHQRGADPKVFKAPEHAKTIVKRDKPYVTLTLRESKHFPERNIDILEWAKFAQHLGDADRVVVIPDAESPDLPEARFPEFCEDLPAAFNLSLRLALYEGAQMNFCSSNGPTALMFYSHCPVIQFDQLRGGTFSAQQWAGLNGFPVGQQHPWSNPNQLMTWTDSTFVTLKEAFDTWTCKQAAA
jgi:hypothetical protein